MKLHDYQHAVLNGMMVQSHVSPIEHAAMGLAGEAGEVLDLFKKAQYEGAPPLPIGKTIDELGDVLWYLVYLAASFGYSLDELAQLNYEKLSERYPGKYPPIVRTLLIDGDTLVFEAALACEYEAQWDDHLWTLHSDLQAAIDHLTGSVQEIREKLKADRIIFALSDPERFRTSIMPSYKQNRKKTRKPIVFKPLRDYAAEVWEVYQRPGLEGDDVLGILATHPTLVDGEKIVVSIDKDLKTIPGKLLNYRHAREAEDWEACIVEVSVEEADRFHLFQTLTGDTTDGYPGCPGVGPVSAEKILGNDPTWAKVVAAYQKQKLGEGVALQNARVARILRAEDFDFKKKEVKLWEPKR